jgi:hypothetical protein
VNSKSCPPADGVKLDEQNGEVKWLFISAQQVSDTIIINYTIELPADKVDTYTFKGSWKATDGNTIESGSTPVTEIQTVKTSTDSTSWVVIVTIAASILAAVTVFMLILKRHSLKR